MIKLLDLSADRQKRVCDWLHDEIEAANSERDEVRDRWDKWQNQFEAKPEQEEKNFPFEKASNIVIPLHAMTVNAVVARQYNTMMGIKPLWTVTPLSSKWTDHAMPTQNFMEYVQKRELRIPVKLVDYFYDKCNMGTAFVKLPWITERVRDKVYGDKGEIIVYEQEASDGARFIPIPIQDFLFPMSAAQDIQTCHWVAHRFRLRFPQMRAREKAGVYTNIAEVEKHYSPAPPDHELKQEERELINRVTERKEHELYEVWADYDVDGDGYEEKCVLTYHYEANKLLRPILNPFKHRRRPFVSVQCFPRPHRVYGIGYGQKLERLQEGITTAANQALDNNTIANTKVMKGRKGKGIKPNQKIYAGKIFLLDDLDDLQEFDLGTLNPYVLNVVNFLRDVSEEISSYNVGKESPVVKSGATATSTLALIQEGTKQFDFLLNIDRLAMTEVAYQVYELYSQFQPRFVYDMAGDKDAQLVEEVWQANQGDVRKGLQFDLTASSAYVNQAVEREAWRMMFDLVTGFYTRLFEVSQVIFDPAAPPQLKALVGKMCQSGQLIMMRLMEQWNIKDSERLIVSQQDLEQLVNASNSMGPPQQPPPNPAEEAVAEQEKIKAAQEAEKLQGLRSKNMIGTVQALHGMGMKERQAQHGMMIREQQARNPSGSTGKGTSKNSGSKR